MDPQWRKSFDAFLADLFRSKVVIESQRENFVKRNVAALTARIAKEVVEKAYRAIEDV